MKKLLLFIALLSFRAMAQVNTPAILFQGTSPTGGCADAPPMRYNYNTGQLWACDSGTWAVISSSGTGNFTPGGTQASGDILYATSVSGYAWLTTANGGLLNTNLSGAPSVTPTPILGVASTTTGSLGFLSASNAFTFTISAAAAMSASSTMVGPVSVPTTGDLLSAVTSSSTFTLTDSGILATNVVTLAGSQTLTNKTLTSPTIIAAVLGTPVSGNASNLTNFPTLNQNTTGTAAAISGTIVLSNTPLTTSQDILYDNAGILARLPIVTSGTCLGNTGGVWASLACSGGSGSGTVNSGTANQIGIYATTGTAMSGDTLLTDNATVLAYTGTGGFSTPSVSTGSSAPSLSGNTSTGGIDAFNNGTCSGTFASGAVFICDNAGVLYVYTSSGVVGPIGLGVSFANAGTTGTTLNTLTTLTGTPSTAVIATTSTTSGVVGIAISGSGTTGSVVIQTSGLVNCVFSNATTAGDYVQISTTTAGNCLDSGASTVPTANGQIIGRVLSTNGSAGTYQIDLFSPGVQPITGTITIGGTAVVLGGSTTSFPTPGAIGGTTPAAGTFTTLQANTSLKLLGSSTGGDIFTSSLGGAANYTITTPTHTANDTLCFQTAANCSSGGGGTGTSVSSVTPVTVSANVTTDQQLMELSLPAGYLNSANQPFLFNGAGVYSTTVAQTPTLTFKVKLCTVSGCGSGTVVTLVNIVTTATIASVTNNNWNLNFMGYTATTGATGNLEIHGPVSVDLGSLTATADSIFNDVNTAVSGNINLTAALFIDFTVATSTGSASNSITQRAGGIMPFAATAAPVTSVAGAGVLFSTTPATGAVALTPLTIAAHTFIGNNTGSTAAYGAQAIGTADLPAVLANQTSINGVAVPSAVGSATVGQVVASGQTAMPTGALSGNSCSASATTATATGAATTDAFQVNYASDPTGVTGYGGGTSGGISIRAWATSNTLNFKLCNETSGSITPGALNVNWRVVR